jgi:rSAM/selenodomain-associated transferase 2
MKLKLSLIIPTYNEEENIKNIFHNICLLKAKEVLIVDGKSEDKTRHLLKKIKLITTKASRGLQLKTGAENSTEKWLFFLHADTKLNEKNVLQIKEFIKKNKNKVGYFHLKFNTPCIFAKIISKWANFRTKFFYLPFGDQCLLVKREYYYSIGGFSEISKMEDMDLILRVSKKNKFFFDSYIETSFEKYRKNGIIKQSFKNILNQIIFFLR